MHIEVSGNVHKDNTVQLAIEGSALEHQKECWCFIVDFSIAELKDSQTKVYQFNTNLDQFGLRMTKRIVVIISHDIVVYLFTETVAANRGWSQMKYSENPELARARICKY